MATKKPSLTPKKASVAKTVRPPVVVIMGHIDHGKSTLLDYIRKSNIVAGEAGGITQHLGAYEVNHEADAASGKKSGKITFLDTPGHEAFCAIRERGARVADIAILVVSAEDGVKPQTLEALKSILTEKLPYIVAINKIDKPEANIERTKQVLAENEIYVEGYGGDVPCVPISALKGTGIPDLLDMINLVADLADLTGDPTVPAAGAVIEANLDSKKGIAATLLIKNGSLESGMFVAAEDAYSPIRILEDFQGKAIKSATFSSPVRIIGWNKLPAVGAPFVTLASKREAEEYVETYLIKKAEEKKRREIRDLKAARDAKTARDAAATAALIGKPGTRPGQTATAADQIVLPLIIKADVTGSLDGIKHELAKIKSDKVLIKIVSESIGSISESDVKSAQSDPNIILIAFNSKPDAKAKNVLERSQIPVRLESFDIIYHLIEFIRNEVTSRIPKEYVEESTGRAKILAIFSKNKDKQILGGKVQEGSILLGAEVKILRRDVEIGKGRFKVVEKKG